MSSFVSYKESLQSSLSNAKQRRQNRLQELVAELIPDLSMRTLGNLESKFPDFVKRTDIINTFNLAHEFQPNFLMRFMFDEEVLRAEKFANELTNIRTSLSASSSFAFDKEFSELVAAERSIANDIQRVTLDELKQAAKKREIERLQKATEQKARDVIMKPAQAKSPNQKATPVYPQARAQPAQVVTKTTYVDRYESSNNSSSSGLDIVDVLLINSLLNSNNQPAPQPAFQGGGGTFDGGGVSASWDAPADAAPAQDIGPQDLGSFS